MKKILTILCAVLCYAAGMRGASTVNPSLSATAWANYTVDTPPGAVYALRASAAGPVWIGSGRGLYSFDGFRAHAVKDAAGQPFEAQIYAIIEEADGALWLGTNNGLFRYDPVSRSVDVASGEFPNEIRAVISDAMGRLWIGSLNGLYLYDPADASLHNLSAGLPHHAVYALLESDADGRIYAGTYDGLCSFDPRSLEVRRVALDGVRGLQGNRFVNALADDVSTAEMYIGMEGALLVYDPASGSVRPIRAMEGNSVKALAMNGRFLTAGTDNGLYVIDRNGSSVCFRHDSRRPASIADNVIWTLMTDSRGNLWAGTGAGVSIAESESAVNEISLADITAAGEGQTIYSIFRDSARRLWLGGNNGLILAPAGLTADADPSLVCRHAQSSPQYPLSHNRVRAITESSDGRVLVAGDGGLNVYDERTRRFRRLRVVDAANTHNANWAYALAEDSAGSRLWIGGYLGGVFGLPMTALSGEDGRVCVADTSYTAESGWLGSNLINNIVRDRSGALWVLLFREGFVTRIDPSDSGGAKRIDIVEATGGWPTLIAPDPDGPGVWVGFDGGGVVRLDADGTPGAAVRIGDSRRPSGLLYAMSAVGRELWIATGDGVYGVDRTSGRVRLLPLPARPYTSIYNDELTGRVLLGTTDALVRVDPLRLNSRRLPREISVVGISVGDKAIEPDAQPVKVPYGTGTVSLELATYDFTPGNFERFAWRCTPDTVWTLLPPQDNRVVLTALAPGRHTLELRLGDDADTAKSVELEVMPPWYFSTAFKLVWALLILGVGLTAFLIARGRNIRNLRIMERRNALEKAEERLNFLTNVSHDLRTPLSMIIGPLSRLKENCEASSEETHRAIDTAYDNALRLNRLLSHTLEASTLDAATDSAAVPRPTDISSLVRKLGSNCATAYPDCSFAVNVPEGEDIIADVDPGKFESIVSNLLSNAIKYSARGRADITITLSTEGPDFILSVADRGMGIMPDQIPHIFERKYRTPRGAGFSDGSGIGLFLVKHFVELHGGSVAVESAVGEGSVFTVRMPLKTASGVLEPKPRRVRAEMPVPDPSRQRVLVADDNDDVLTFIGTLLEPRFQCVFASDGASALELAGAFRPDLIITDEKMPLMSGLEMVRRLKSSPATASISVILLTAMTSTDLESRSISAGVDLFMTKPFDPSLLVARVESVLRRKAEIRRAARIEEITASRPPENEETEAERMLARVSGIVEENLASASLSVAFVCEQAGLQPKQLYRLIKKYLDLSPVEYIRNMRLDHAAALLAAKDLTVSEVMYRSGFNSPSYFAKCFRQRFHTSPGEYNGEA